MSSSPVVLRREVSGALYRAGVDHEWKVLGGFVERDMVLEVHGDEQVFEVVEDYLRRLVDATQ